MQGNKFPLMKRTSGLIILLFLFIASCNNSQNTQTENNQKTTKEDKLINDYLFATTVKCISDSNDTKLYWTGTFPVISDEEIEGEESKTSIEETDNKSILGYSNNRKQILEFIDSFPAIGIRPDTIRLVRVSSSTNLSFVCNNDTLLDFSWDPGRYQININGQWYIIY